MPKFANRVKETSTTTGTGTLDLAGGVTGFFAFADELTTGDEVWYLIVDDPDNPVDFEFGIGTFTTGVPNLLSRDTVEGSSNSGNKVSWAAGTKTVIATPTASSLTGGWQLIETQTASASSSLDFTTGIDGTYDKYMLVITEFRPATDGQDLKFRTSADGGSTFRNTNEYQHGLADVTSGGTLAGSGGTAQDAIFLTTNGVGNLADETYNGTVEFYMPASTDFGLRLNHLGTWLSAAALFSSAVGGGEMTSAEDTNAFQLIFGAGNIASGRGSLYRMHK